jgi:hypothetical protein
MTYSITLVTPISRETVTASGKLFGFLPAEMAQGATVYAAGAVNPQTVGESFVVAPSTEWKGWEHAKNRAGSSRNVGKKQS